MNGMNFKLGIIFAIILQGVALTWFLANQNAKIDTLYKEFESTNKKEVITNQVKMKLDLENIIADVGELKKVIKKLKSKDQTLVSQNKKINKDHKKLFEILLNEDTANSNRSYSYGD